MQNRVLLWLVLVGLIAVACGGGDDVGSATTTPGVTVSDGTAQVGTGTTAPVTIPEAGPAGGGDPPRGLKAEIVARALRSPVFLTAPTGSADLYVLEKGGLIVRIAPDGTTTEFIDLTSDVRAAALEQGLLGMAFHPDYASNGRFFVYYTDRGGTSRLYEYHAAPDRSTGDPGSARLILSQEQPEGNHNAGMLQFGPDGYLYVAFGDGGGANDEHGHGQRTDTLLATIVRIDVDGAEPYAIPPDNPFVGGGGLPEIWAFGLRNPWRFDIDPVEGLLYIGDVGQDEWEEVDVARYDAAGLNYGWPIAEGPECFDEQPCDLSPFVAPALSYEHDQGCSVTGGYVYRGAAIPEMYGHYFYGDWCGRWVRSFRYEGTVAAEHDWTTDLGDIGQVVSFGVDGFGELYVLSGDGFVFKIAPRG